MTLLLLIVPVWTAALLIVAGLCAAAHRGDVGLARPQAPGEAGGGVLEAAPAPEAEPAEPPARIAA